MNEEHVAILKQGVEAWNKWRADNKDVRADLSGADLSGTDLSGADLSGAIYNKDTSWPPGFNPRRAGAVGEGFLINIHTLSQSSGCVLTFPLLFAVAITLVVLAVVVTPGLFSVPKPITPTKKLRITSTPTPNSTPTPTPILEIAVLNIDIEVQDDGRSKQTAHLSIENMGYGDLELIAPDTTRLGDSRLVWLTITPEDALEEFLAVSNDTILTNNPDYGIPINDRIQLYPVMIAELTGVNFEIEPSGPQRQVVTSDSEVFWSWSIKAKGAGRQLLFVSISIPVLIDRTNEEVSKQLKNIPIEVFVEVTPTPAPTDTPLPPTLTPVPFIDTSGGGALVISGSIIGSVLLIGLIVIAVVIAVVFLLAPRYLPTTGIKAIDKLTLTTLYRNLARLQEKRANYGMDVPVKIENEIEDTKQKIAEIEDRIR